MTEIILTAAGVLLALAFLLALVGIYALLAIPFRSYFQPIIVTLSSMAIVRGIGMAYSDSRPIFGTRGTNLDMPQLRRCITCIAPQYLR